MYQKGWQKNVLRNQKRALENGANVDTGFASRSPKAASSSIPEVINFYYTVKGLYFGNFAKFML